MKTTIAVFLLVSLTFSASAAADRDAKVKDAITSLEEGIELLKKGKLKDGAEEVRWGLELIDKAMQSGVDKLFPAEVDLGEVGVFTGGEISKNKVLGSAITERIYKNKQGIEIKMTFTRSTAAGQGGLMQGIGTLAKLGFGQGEGVRFGGVRGSAMNSSGEKTVMLTLDDGSVLTLSSRAATMDVVKRFTRNYPIRELNETTSAK